MKVALAAFLLAARIYAAAPAANVRVEFLCAEVPLADGIHLMATGRNDAPAIGKEIDQLIAAGKVSIIDSTIVWARDGESGSSEQIVEERCATEFDPPQFPMTFKGIPPKRIEPPMEKARRMTSGRIAVPTAFDTRNIGLTLDLQPSVSTNSRLIRLQMRVQRVFFDGLKATMKDLRQAKAGADWQPEFRTRSLDTALTVEPGQWSLLDCSPRLERFQFSLIRAIAIPSPP